MMLGKLFCQTNYYKKHYRRAEFLGGCLVGSPIHTAVFGSTQIMYAVDFSKIPSFSGVNFALPVQPLKYDAMILEKALKNMPPVLTAISLSMVFYYRSGKSILLKQGIWEIFIMRCWICFRSNWKRVRTVGLISLKNGL